MKVNDKDECRHGVYVMRSEEQLNSFHENFLALTIACGAFGQDGGHLHVSQWGVGVHSGQEGVVLIRKLKPNSKQIKDKEDRWSIKRQQ